VVVGAGMSGLAVVEELLKRRAAGEWAITLLGEEHEPAYNRIMLSKLLAGTCGASELELRPKEWYASRAVELRTGPGAAALDLDRGEVLECDGARHSYDALVLATGSRPFVPPIDGSELAHVHTFRTLRDARTIAAAASAGQPAVVVGGGLLGLEAAAGLRARGMQVSVVEFSDRVMPQQLDGPAAAILTGSLERLGLRLLLGTR
jgi:NAD(P)H-nitrite reductase large subunit